jgi:hypothetical protein
MKFFIPILATMSLLVSCSESGPTVTTDEVIVKTANMDVHFVRVKPFAQTYMIFGGMEMNQSDAFSKVSLSGLDINTARYIYSRYPDFHQCKSPGAPLAQKGIRQLDIVPTDSQVMKDLRQTLADHETSIQQGGKRVCVRLEGEVLKLRSAIVRNINEDITDKLPAQVHHEYFFVESAEIVDPQEALSRR